MTVLHESLIIAATYVAGCLTGHRVVSTALAYAKAVEARFHAKLEAIEANLHKKLEADAVSAHEKLDKLIAKTVNTVYPLRK